MSLRSENLLRIALALCGFASVFFAPPWVPVVCATLLALRFCAWEVVVMGLFADFMWLPSGSLFHPIPLFTIGALALVWLFEPLRTRFLII